MTNRGKEICKTLKEIRQKVAEENDIPLKEHECTYEGDCNGTCPHCDAELRYIEGELENRKADSETCSLMKIELPIRERSDEKDSSIDDMDHSHWLLGQIESPRYKIFERID